MAVALITLVYASRATRPMTQADLTELLEVARDRNGREDVSGMLLYAYDGFMQQLEGPPDAVNDIYESISRDPRHTGLRLLTRRTIVRRRYPEWTMGFDAPDPQTLMERLPGYQLQPGQPLIASELVASADVAETLLAASALAA